MESTGEQTVAADPPAAPRGPGPGAVPPPRSLSYSRVNTYEICPRQYRYAYVDRLPRKPPGPEASFGTSVHAALEAWWGHPGAVPGVTAPPAEVALRALYDGWDRTGFQARGIPRDEEVAAYRRAQRVVAAHVDRHAPAWRPAVTNEARFAIVVDGLPDVQVIGYIDHVARDGDGRLVIVDWKTGKPKTREQVAGSLQLAVYALACEHLFGEPPAAVAMEFVADDVRVTVPVEDIRFDGVVERLEAVVDAHAAGAFPVTPGPLCGWCDHRDVCPVWQGPPGATLGDELLALRRRAPLADQDAARLAALEGVLATL